MTETTPRDLIAELRAEGKEWREQVGDMPVFDRAADALENALDELDAMHSWGGLMKLLEEHWPADIFGNSDGRDKRADPGPRIVSLINALDAAQRENERLRAVSHFLVVTHSDHETSIVHGIYNTFAAARDETERRANLEPVNVWNPTYIHDAEIQEWSRELLVARRGWGTACVEVEVDSSTAAGE